VYTLKQLYGRFNGHFNLAQRRRLFPICCLIVFTAWLSWFVNCFRRVTHVIQYALQRCHLVFTQTEHRVCSRVSSRKVHFCRQKTCHFSFLSNLWGGLKVTYGTLFILGSLKSS